MSGTTTATLERLAGPTGIHELLAIDHRGSLRRLVRPADPNSLSPGELIAVKLDVVAALGAVASGVMLDPAPAAATLAAGELDGGARLIATCEEDGYAAVSGGLPARLVDGWALERVPELGAGAIKLLIQQPIGNPELARKDREFARAMCERGRELGLCVVLEVLVPGGDPSRETEWVDALLAATEELSPLGDLYKTSFPQLDGAPEDAGEAVDALTRASARPWVVLSAGVSHELFARQLRVACEHGASGFLVGRSVWGDAVAAESGRERRRLLAEVAVPRFEEYAEIARRAASPSGRDGGEAA